jgi:hypothetical protein
MSKGHVTTDRAANSGDTRNPSDRDTSRVVSTPPGDGAQESPTLDDAPDPLPWRDPGIGVEYADLPFWRWWLNASGMGAISRLLGERKATRS